MLIAKIHCLSQKWRFITWKYLIDKAVEYDFREHIGYCGFCKFQSFRDYQAQTDDIEALEAA
ncbi:MAG: hypothetical protein IPJ39_14355 [Saprospiraceae bacterium]|nr:hypothetical protein [Saprospiraceae bacterium]